MMEKPCSLRNSIALSSPMVPKTCFSVLDISQLTYCFLKNIEKRTLSRKSYINPYSKPNFSRMVSLKYTLQCPLCTLSTGLSTDFKDFHSRSVRVGGIGYSSLPPKRDRPRPRLPSTPLERGGVLVPAFDSPIDL